jgi:hypothetical protein
VHTEDDDRKTATVGTVLAVADELGIPAAQVALGWLLERNRSSATALVPVTGPRNLAQLEDYLAALDVRLDDDQYRRLDEASQIPLGQPHDLNNSRRAPLLGGSAFESPVVPVASAAVPVAPDLCAKPVARAAENAHIWDSARGRPSLGAGPGHPAGCGRGADRGGSGPRLRWSSGLADPAHEAIPVLCAEREPRTSRVGGIADREAPDHFSNFHAGTAALTAVGRLAPDTAAIVDAIFHYNS